LVAVASGAAPNVTSSTVLPTTTDSCTTTSWGGSNGWTGLAINGDAAVVGTSPNDVLRVTPDVPAKAGSAFTTNTIALTDDLSFSTHFVFKFSKDPGTSDPGADGLVFVIQPQSNSVGTGGEGIGFSGIDNSLGVELDDFFNPGSDSTDSDIGLDFNGSVASITLYQLGQLNPPVDLDDGVAHNVWIDFDSTTHIIEVRFADNGTRPTDPVLNYQVNLSAQIGTTDAFVGFTSATGAFSANHDVLSWQFADCYVQGGVGGGDGGGGGGGENTAPTVSAGDDASGAEGSPVSLDGSVTDPDAAQTVTKTWSYAWDSTSPDASKASGTCSFTDEHAVDTDITCTDNGLVKATLTANDGTDTSSDTASVTVTNVAPDVGLTAPDDASTGTTYDVGATVPLGVTVDDPGSNDTFMCTVDWGDGTGDGPTAGGCVSGHAYAAADVYSVTVTVEDDDKDSGTASVDVDVEAPDDGGGSGRAEVTGGGFVQTLGKTHFSLHADADKKGRQHGHLDLHTYDKHHFDSHVVTGLTVNGSTASWAGTGTWDHLKGYSYTITVVDGGDGKLKAADHIVLYIRDPDGAIVFMLSGNLSGGNIKVHPKH